MSCAVGLIALAVGYLVFLQGSKEKEGLKLLGQVIGIVVMIAAVLAVACGASQCKYLRSHCGGGHEKGGMCPVSGKMTEHEMHEMREHK